MKIVLLFSMLFSLNIFSQDIMNCRPSNTVDEGESLTLEKNNEGQYILKSYEITFAGETLVAATTLPSAKKINHKFIDKSSSACSLSFVTKVKTDLGFKTIILNVFNDQFVGYSVKHYVPGYLKCQYLQAKNPEVLCAQGGENGDVLVHETIMTTEDFSYFAFKENQEYSPMTCDYQGESDQFYNAFISLASCQSDDLYINNLEK